MFSLFTSSATRRVNQLMAFVRDIGIEVREAPISQPSFLPGLLIDQGQLVVDRQQLLYPGDLLHEAGHIAVTTAAERPLLGWHVTENQPEKEGDEMAVLLWTYAACQTLDIPAEVVFHPQGYKGQSQWILNNFRQGSYVGLPLLVWMGMTTTAGFPHMERWLRE
jgi:hypothetical protein